MELLQTYTHPKHGAVLFTDAGINRHGDPATATDINLHSAVPDIRDEIAHSIRTGQGFPICPGCEDHITRGLVDIVVAIGGAKTPWHKRCRTSGPKRRRRT